MDNFPALAGKIAPYAGQPMAPFAESDKLPYIAEMISAKIGAF